MSSKTICLVCERKGRGFTIKEILTKQGRVIWGAQIIDPEGYPKVGPVDREEPEAPISLTKWLQKNAKEEHIQSAYIYHFSAPGEWCQMIWVVDDEIRRTRIKDLIEERRWDISGDYLHGKTLNSLTKEEKTRLYETVIRA